MTQETHKKCTSCKELKLFSNFYKMKTGKYGLKSTCIPCYLVYQREKRNLPEAIQKRKKSMYRINRALKTRYWAMLSRHKKFSGKVIEFDEYSILIKNNCYYCKSLLPEAGIGLDRINNTIGYTINNVIPCCANCNMTRGDRYSIEEMKCMIGALISFRANNI